MCEEFADILGIEVGVTDNFFELGGHSLIAAQVVSRINRRLSASITVRNIFACPVVADLAEKVSEPPGPLTTDKIDLRAEFQKFQQRLAGLSLPKPSNFGTWKTPKSFLVTGASGFLGSSIVNQLLQRPEVCRVICLVRGDNDDHANKKMIRAAQKGRWWRHEFARRLEVWRGDLSRPRLGLDDSRWKRIGAGPTSNDAVGAIIHNGAIVHFQASYQHISDANINSTVDLLSAWSLAPSPPRFLYIMGGYFTGAEESDDQVLELLSGAHSYAQTKFISEMLVRHQSERVCQLRPDAPRPRVVKPGMIIGDAAHGVCNVDDFIWRVVASAIRINGYNSQELDDPNAWLLLAGSDQIASRTVDSCMQSSVETQPVRFVDGVPVGLLWRILMDEHGYALKPMSAEEWLRHLKDDIDREGASHPLYPVFDILQQSQGFLGIPRPTDGVPIFPVEETALRLRTSIDYLKEIGFFRTTTGQRLSSSTPGLVFRRSGVDQSKHRSFRR